MGLKSDIDSCFQSVSEGKSAIASAITDKGVSTASDATFQTMATNISKISGKESHGTCTISGNYTAGTKLYFMSSMPNLPYGVDDIRENDSHTLAGYFISYGMSADRIVVVYKLNGSYTCKAMNISVGGFNGPYTDGTFVAYYNGHYHLYEMNMNSSSPFVELNSNYYLEELIGSRTEAPSVTIPYSSNTYSYSFSGTSRTDRTFTDFITKLSNKSRDKSGTVIGGSRSEEDVYASFHIQYIEKTATRNDYALIFTPASIHVYEFTDTGYPVPFGQISTTMKCTGTSPDVSPNAQWWNVPYEGTVISTDGTSSTVEIHGMVSDIQ